MARNNRLSIGILSPLQTDTSLNDSTFSFGSPSGISEYNKDNINKHSDKNSDKNSFCKKTLKESSIAFQVVPNVKKQTDINAEREVKFKESYEVLRQSMDDLFYAKTPTSFLSPVSKDEELEVKEYLNDEGIFYSNINENKMDEESQNLKAMTSASETCSEISSKKSERIQKVNKASSVNREQKNYHLKTVSSVKLSENNTDGKLSHGQKHKTSKTSSASTQTNKSLEVKQSATKKLHPKMEGNERAVKDFQFKSQQKIAASNKMPTPENKSLSLEKSIEIAVSMEMDKMRNLILDQNLTLQKEIFKLQDMVQKQATVIGYLYTVVDELLETNKKLKHK